MNAHHPVHPVYVITAEEKTVFSVAEKCADERAVYTVWRPCGIACFYTAYALVRSRFDPRLHLFYKFGSHRSAGHAYGAFDNGNILFFGGLASSFHPIF